MEDALKEIAEIIQEIVQDSTVPKNVISKLQETIEVLQTDEDKSIKVDKALNILDELAEDSNVPAYTRTQLWNVISALEAA